MNCMNLGTLRMLIVGCGLFLSAMIQAQRSEFLLEKNWKFTKGDVTGAVSPEFDDSKWETVSVPHDWAIFGPFDRNNDLQNVAITQNFEKKASGPCGRQLGRSLLLAVWLSFFPLQRYGTAE